MRKILSAALFLILSTSVAWGSSPSTAGGIHWVPWSKEVFVQAKKEQKKLILNLEAVWCHWCHVMEKDTYSNPKVIELIGKHFIAIKVDQDSRPDISRRYEDFGWPATIFFNSNGKEIEKKSGFFPATEMVTTIENMLRAPTEDEENAKQLDFPQNPLLSKELRAELEKTHQDRYDRKIGGWGDGHKFLFGDTEELALRNGSRGNKEELKRAVKTLDAALGLLDPVWGGAFQYSVKTWKKIHFEKIADTQMRNLFLFSLGYEQTGNKKYLVGAMGIRKFLNEFFRSPQNSYYTSQDADLERGVHSEGYFQLSDVKRRAKGIPVIDKHLYARENGWFISGLAALYAASEDPEVLTDAVRAANWVEKNRNLGKGGYSHGERDDGGPFLGDTLEMGIAYLNLYQVTGEKSYLEKAILSAKYIQNHFSHEVGELKVGFVPSNQELAPGMTVEPKKKENIRVARFANLLWHYTQESKFKAMAEQAARYLAAPEIARKHATAGVLLVQEELTTDPPHFAVSGAREDGAAKALFQAAAAYPLSYKTIEWIDKDGKSLSPIELPKSEKVAAFVCAKGKCSAPIGDPRKLKIAVSEFLK